VAQPLNNALVAVLVWLVVLYGAADDACARRSVVSAGALWSGLALCNQLTAVLVEAPLVGWVLWHEVSESKRSKAKRSEAKQSKAKQSKAKQNKAKHVVTFNTKQNNHSLT